MFFGTGALENIAMLESLFDKFEALSPAVSLKRDSNIAAFL